MDKNYDHNKFEEEIYKRWEESGAFKAKSDGKPFTILMPPPNANASLHAGHAMYTIDDIMVRWKRMQGHSAVWIPGRDHAGFETQYVYEKQLAKEGKSRMDFDRKTLYDNVYKFVEENSNLIFQQFRRLGLSADWNRAVFTLDPHVLERVNGTFKQMEAEKRVYRSNYMVNYCTHCGTSLSELEVDHEDRTDPLYYMRYGPFVLATVRPETKFGDTAVAVHPKDKRYKKFIGQEIEIEGLIGSFKIKVVADDVVDPKFGTGAVKVTPAHDPVDFEIGKRHGLEIKQVIGLDGRLNEKAGKYAGLKVMEARRIVATDLKSAGLMEKIDENYSHSVGVCYRCKRALEPMVVPNWFIKVDELKKPVISAVKNDEVKFFPKKFKKIMTDWLTRMHDWPISRQIVWGIRIPVWYEIENNVDMRVYFKYEDVIVGGNINELLSYSPTTSSHRTFTGNYEKVKAEGLENKSFTLEEIKSGLQKVIAPANSQYVVSDLDPTSDKFYLPETDTFDTWFSSGQWPLVTLTEEEFESRLPTDFMGTLEDILPFWISRMIMFSLYIKHKVPYKQVYLWSKVTDSKGQKMSKSKGNVVNPVELIDKYGADAVRMALIFGVAPGSNIPFSEEKIRGMRNFANKIWNMGRFIQMLLSDYGSPVPDLKLLSDSLQNDDEEVLKKLSMVIKTVTKSLDQYRFSDAAECIYEFTWHVFADIYIEKVKLKKTDPAALATVRHVFSECIKLLHPFMPFVTEAVWMETNNMSHDNNLLISSSWPVTE